MTCFDCYFIFSCLCVRYYNFSEISCRFLQVSIMILVFFNIFIYYHISYIRWFVFIWGCMALLQIILLAFLYFHYHKYCKICNKCLRTVLHVWLPWNFYLYLLTISHYWWGVVQTEIFVHSFNWFIDFFFFFFLLYIYYCGIVSVSTCIRIMLVLHYCFQIIKDICLFSSCKYIVQWEEKKFWMFEVWLLKNISPQSPYMWVLCLYNS